MARIELRTLIRAPRERVWEVLTDLSGQSRWMEDIHRMAVVSDVKGGAGTRIDARTKLFGLPVLHDIMEVVTWDAPRTLEVVHRGHFTGTGAFRLEPNPEGTVFVWEEEFEPPLGALGEVAVRFFVGPHLRRVWKRSMENVRRIAESTA